jgi:hypothetical protein
MQFGGPACIQMKFDPAGTWVRVHLCWTVAVLVTITRNKKRLCFDDLWPDVLLYHKKKSKQIDVNHASWQKFRIED